MNGRVETLAQTAIALDLSEQDTVKVAGLDPSFQPVALLHQQRVLARGVPFTFGSVRRSVKKQAELFRDLPPGQAAKPGTSKHEIGFAYDVRGPSTAAQWDIVGAEGEALGLRWGGRFTKVREPWHFEAPFSRQQLQFSQVLRVASFASVVAVGIFAIRKATDG